MLWILLIAVFARSAEYSWDLDASFDVELVNDQDVTLQVSADETNLWRLMVPMTKISVSNVVGDYDSGYQYFEVRCFNCAVGEVLQYLLFRPDLEKRQGTFTVVDSR